MPNIPDDRKAAIIAYEGFIRRAAALDMPFMLKGSYVTRQYFANPDDRIPNDLDWAYLERLEYQSDAEKIFDKWMIWISEQEEDDGVRFSSFRQHRFWRMMDYAMADDFPTVNTDLPTWVDGESIYNSRIDISFNLPIDAPPVPLQYTPVRGKPFTITNTVPLSLQVSWKLHQTLKRARFKDIFDLMHLVAHPAFTPEVMQETLQALVNECTMDYVDPAWMQYFLDGWWQKTFQANPVQSEWNLWRHGKNNGIYYDPFEERAFRITDANKLPETLSVFTEQVLNAFRKAGFFAIDFNNLPAPTRLIELPPEFAPPQEAPAPKQIRPIPPSTSKGLIGFLKRLFE